MTKRELDILEQFAQSTNYKLTQCYKTPSTAKVRAYNECMIEAMHYHFIVCRILSYNVQMFTFAFLYKDGYSYRMRYRTNRTMLDFEVPVNVAPLTSR